MALVTGPSLARAGSPAGATPARRHELRTPPAPAEPTAPLKNKIGNDACGKTTRKKEKRRKKKIKDATRLKEGKKDIDRKKNTDFEDRLKATARNENNRSLFGGRN